MAICELHFVGCSVQIPLWILDKLAQFTPQFDDKMCENATIGKEWIDQFWG